MPKADRDEIIELTEIVEEGHPETPNLSPAASTPATREDTLDDLDLEKEIDQIFADLNAPEETARHTAPEGSPEESPSRLHDASQDAFQDDPGRKPSSTEDHLATDTLNFDDLFKEADDQHPAEDTVDHSATAFESLDVTHPPEANERTTDVSGPDAADDFERLFAEESESFQKPATTDPETSVDTSPEEALPGPDGLPPSPEEAEAVAAHSAAADTSDDINILDEEPAEARTEPSIAQSPNLPETDPPTHDTFNDDSGEQHQADHPVSSQEQPRDDAQFQAALPESFLKRLQELEERLAGLEERESPQPDRDSLLAQLEQRISERFDSSLEALRHAVDNLPEQAQASAQQLFDARQATLAAEATTEVEQRLEKMLTERVSEHLDTLKATIISDLEPRIASMVTDQRVQDDGLPDAQEAEFIARLDGLQEQLNQLTQQETKSSAPEGGLEENPEANLEESLAPMLQKREEQLETRLLETFRQEMDTLRASQENQAGVLNQDLKNIQDSWTTLQAKFMALQEEWQTFRQEISAPPPETLEASEAHGVDPLNSDASVLDAHLDIRLAAFKSDLLEELQHEIHAAVPLAAAQIIREEIEALSREEDEDESNQS
ncbi:hypothetical protein [Desulfonatronum thioautotrophicum]|uniref:hypothetical protein n=1 Tax=Desulfonatronum thioautotrophicum TaxID=617001 RepID=UPI0005EB7DC8|nr:hypothetical protein [Desulfonatronum thioautotrophicum]